MGYIGNPADYERWRSDEALANRRLSQGSFGKTYKRAEDSPAMQRAFAALGAQKRRTDAREIKFLAQRFLDHRSTLNSLYPGLSSMCTSDLIRYARSALGIEARQKISGADMIMNVRAMNLYAAWIVGRYERRFERQLSEVA